MQFKKSRTGELPGEQDSGIRKQISSSETSASAASHRRRPGPRAPAYVQQGGNDPRDNAVNVLKTAFTGPIATGLSLVAIVVGGLMFAFAEGQSKRLLAGIVFGIGMAVGAVNFMAWLFPGG